MDAILDVIGPDLRDGPPDAPVTPTSLDWIAALAAIIAFGGLLVVMGQGAGRRGEDDASLLFWSGVVLTIVPATLRIAMPSITRAERLVLLLILAGGLFFYKSVYSPTSFAGHDEFLHWIAADDLMTAGRLFLSNPLLPVATDYPALEIVTSDLVQTTALPLFVAATLLLAVLRGVFVGVLFLFFERVTGSARLAAIATLVYMGCSTFVTFDTQFSYESLGVVFCVASFALAARAGSRQENEPAAVVLIMLLLAALAVTHHLSAAYAATYFAAVAVLEILRRGATRAQVATSVVLAAAAIAMPLSWMWIRGNSLVDYFGPVLDLGLHSLLLKIQHFGQLPEHAAESINMPSQPMAIRLVTISGILLISLGLSTGFFRSLALAAPRHEPSTWRTLASFVHRRWGDSRIAFLTFVAFGFPISTAFRLTIGGWEIGNRMGTFVFLAVGLVVAVSVVHFWQARMRRGVLRVLPALALAIIAMGGVTASSVNPIRGPYRAGADSESIERMSIETASWTRDWIGPGNRFVADRANRLLLGGYGRQDTKVEIAPGVDTSRIYEPEKLPADDLWSLSRSDVDFLLVDMRLSKYPSVFGFYFDPWESTHGAPLSPKALLKFDDIKGVGRIYDNGWIKIYDVRGLHGRL